MPCFALVSCLPVDVSMGLLSPFREPETIESVDEAIGRILDAVLGDLKKLRLALGERGEPKDVSCSRLNSLELAKTRLSKGLTTEKRVLIP